MNRLETARRCREQGYNCAQSVLAAFSDRLDISADTALRLAAGFGGGAGTGELCGAITGALLTLNLASDDGNDPLSAKRAAAGRARAVQERFTKQFGAVRCRDLLRGEKEEVSEAVRALGAVGHCGVMIASAVEIVGEMLKEEQL